MLVCDLGGRLFGVKDTGDAECKVQVVGGRRKAGFAMGGSSRYGGFI